MIYTYILAYILMYVGALATRCLLVSAESRLSRYASFQNVGSAALGLLRVATADSWSQLMMQVFVRVLVYIENVREQTNTWIHSWIGPSIHNTRIYVLYA